MNGKINKINKINKIKTENLQGGLPVALTQHTSRAIRKIVWDQAPHWGKRRKNQRGPPLGSVGLASLAGIFPLSTG